ncbi:FAD-linked oxidase-like protein [Hyaloraphidium curvatum]|nr:FAD-linked oxidase-like protein [Hyaloraphidium curvatum]
MSGATNERLLKSLADLFPGGDQVVTSESDLEARTHDVTLVLYGPKPLASVYVKTEGDIVKVMKWASTEGVKVIPFAAGSSLEGHVVPLPPVNATPEPTIVLDCSNMDKVIEVRPHDLDCEVEPGIGWMDLERQLKPTGLFFPPDPGAAAALGGMCGTSCSGTLAWKWGTMRENVLSLRVVLADGTVVKTRSRATKSSAGYDLTRLFIGSEGTLGVVSSCTLRLKRIPTHKVAATLQFSTLEGACRLAHAIVERCIPLQRLEIMDAEAVRAVNIHYDAELPIAPLMLLDVAGQTKNEVESLLRQTEELVGTTRAAIEAGQAGAGGAFGVIGWKMTWDEKEAEELWSTRKRAFFASRSLRKDLLDKKVKLEVLVTDVAVPISKLAEALPRMQDLAAKYNLVNCVVAHAGDGNWHNLLVVKEGDHEEIERAELFKDAMAELAISLGGTCTGEHGVGTGKKHLLEKELGPEAVALMRTIKKALDPRNILNPGKVIDLDPKAPPRTHWLGKPKL